MSNELQAPGSEDREHAILSASSAKRWLTCTPSARFEDQYQDTTSSYAEEGTVAHALASAKIEAARGDEAKIHDSPYYNQEMEEYMVDYVSFVFERYNAALARTPDAMLFSEQRLDYSTWVPEGFGTGDVIIIGAGTLEIIDLKYGAGVPVTAQDNPQIKLYGAGAWAAFDMLFDIDTIITTICQPRLDSITTCSIPATELLAWLQNEVQPKASQAWEGAGDFNPGEHCHFCRALPHCRALADYNLALAQYEFAPAQELTPDDIADILGRGALLAKWVGKMQEYALATAISGTVYPGWKIVEGRSSRKYTDQDKVADVLKAAGFADAILYTHDLLGISAMEKAIGKKTFTQLLVETNQLVSKAPGAPTLTKETDKRSELGSTQAAISDFAE